MRKDKQWLKEEVKRLSKKGVRLTVEEIVKGPKVFLNSVLELIDQLDEPETLSEEWIDEHTWNNHYIGIPFVYVDDLQNLLVPKQEKPVIPQFVAYWIERQKQYGNEPVFISMKRLINQAPQNVVNWFNNNLDLYARAWLDGYEVDKEKVYYVLDKEGVALLKKSVTGEGVDKSIGVNINNAKSWKDEKKYQLTEQEIKDYDKRYWIFAKEVTE